jgi:arylsulfatase A-like enzyme
VIGKWVLTSILTFKSLYDTKWVGLESRGASEINGAFFQWLGRRRSDRPFFAFLNYFDAHDPYIPPPGYDGRFGIQPQTARDFLFLINLASMSKNQASARDIMMVRDCYDDCIAFLDEQLGRLLEMLKHQGLLENTDVIITSDHGEGFGEHRFFGHSYTANIEEIGVPLVILSPASPAGRVVDSPVSLRDLPATVVDLLGISAASPFPGGSLAACWKRPPGEAPPGVISPAFSEQADETAFQAQPGGSRKHPGLEMSLVARGHHYVRHGMGNELLYDLRTDPSERSNLAKFASGTGEIAVFRRLLLDVLTANSGSIEVEKAYLANYRSWLEDLVRGEIRAVAQSR